MAFVAGPLVLLVALNPPLDDWSDNYLSSAHMLQHMLLMFLTAPLWIVGMPDWLLRGLISRGPVGPIGYLLTRPAVAHALANLIAIAWHLPLAYNGALHHEPVRIVQHLSFLFAALLAWWPVFGSLPELPRLAPLPRRLYLFAMTVPGGILGAFVTMAEPGLYDYAESPRILGMSLATDHVIAGLMMWVLASVFYLAVITLIFLKWAGDEEAREGYQRRPLAAPRTDAPARLDSSTSRLS